MLETSVFDGSSNNRVSTTGKLSANSLLEKGAGREENYRLTFLLNVPTMVGQ